jgi:hypothetical protein
MRLELAERLRCPSAHMPTPLIVVAQRSADRELISAILGCPVCRLEARIVDGDVRFDLTSDGATGAAASEETIGEAPELERVVALLGLSEPGSTVLLTGRYAMLAGPLAALADASVVVMTGPASPASGVSAVHGSTDMVPFSDGTFRAVALDSGLPSAFVADAVRATAIGGRVLGAAAVPAPTGLKELARDDTEWVAARESGGAIVELKRRV